MSAVPVTQGTRFLKARGAPHTPCPYDYLDHGGTARAAQELGVDEHAVIKTLVFEDESKTPYLVLMHGDREVSAKGLARQIGVKTLAPCAPEAAQRHTGYQVGGISPFGTRKALPVLVEKTILELPEMYVNAGKRGLLVRLSPSWLEKLLPVRLVEAGR